MEGGNKMTREEQILNKAIDYSEIEENFLEYDDCGDVCNDKYFVEKAFIEGAKWAYNHQDLSEEEQVGMGELGMIWQKKHLIDKACEWLQENVNKYSYVIKIENTKYRKVHFTDSLIEDFSKAMLHE
jgi:hypothetical protein